LRCQPYWTACAVVSAHDIFLYWHASTEHDQANRWLRDQLTAAFPEV
jgi:DNA-binding transcriptional LysR family regulator